MPCLFSVPNVYPPLKGNIGKTVGGWVPRSIDGGKVRLWALQIAPFIPNGTVVFAMYAV